MFALMLTLLLQSGSLEGTLQVPPGTPPPANARVVLLPLEYAKRFNALTQLRLDEYWEVFKASGMAHRNKEFFIRYMPYAYSTVLENVVSEMRREGINTANLIKTAPGGEFQFNNIAPGEYKLVATASLRGEDNVWSATIQVPSSRLVVQVKYRVP